MTWPAKWVNDMETAGSIYNTVTAMNRALATLDGDALAKWKNENLRLVTAYMGIERIRGEGDNGE